jgi:hypothetical protein
MRDVFISRSVLKGYVSGPVPASSEKYLQALTETALGEEPWRGKLKNGNNEFYETSRYCS